MLIDFQSSVSEHHRETERLPVALYSFGVGGARTRYGELACRLVARTDSVEEAVNYAEETGVHGEMFTVWDWNETRITGIFEPCRRFAVIVLSLVAAACVSPTAPPVRTIHPHSHATYTQAPHAAPKACNHLLMGICT